MKNTNPEEYPFKYRYARPVLAVDALVFGIMPDVDELCVFLQKKNQANKRWALAGRWMHCGNNPDNEVAEDDNWTLEETLESALVREWETRMSFVDRYMSDEEASDLPPSVVRYSYEIDWNKDFEFQLGARSDIDRDTRKIRIVTIPYMSLVLVSNPVPPNLSKVACWAPISEINLESDDELPDMHNLDHDHRFIVKEGLKALFSEIRTRPIGKEILPNPDEFDISDLIRIYTLCLDQMGLRMDRSNLRKLLMGGKDNEKGGRGVVEVIKRRDSHDRTRKGGDLCKFTSKYDEYVRLHNFAFNPRKEVLKD